MENLVTETVADQGFPVSAEDDTRLVSALPTNDAEEVVLEELTKNTVNAVDADAPRADVIADLVHGIESLTKDDACATPRARRGSGEDLFRDRRSPLGDSEA